MAEIRHIEGEVGPEILGEIGTGLIINHAMWSGPSQAVRDFALRAAPEVGIPRVFVIDHDHAVRFIRLFMQGDSSPCHGWGDLIFVRNGSVKKACHKFESLTQISPWLRSVVTP